VVLGIVLAAGASSRFGSPKQRLLVGDVVARARESQALDDLLVVVGAHEVETDAQVVPCAEWERGPGASLRCGFGAAALATEAAVVLLADGPDLAPAAIDRVVGSWRAGLGPVLAASYGGERSHPVVLDRSVWRDVPDEGARALEAVLVDCDDLGAPGDVNVPADLPSRFRSRNGGVT
jgi:CTP:molybdopterin cytidylyltransferase MocA